MAKSSVGRKIETVLFAIFVCSVSIVVIMMFSFLAFGLVHREEIVNSILRVLMHA